MPAHIVTTEDLMVFKEEFLEELKEVLAPSYRPAQRWLPSAEFRERPNISTSTLRRLRINGVLSYSKVGGTLFYPLARLECVSEERLIPKTPQP